MNKSSFWLFMIGLGSQTQFHFIGSLGVSELPVFLLAPFFFIQDYSLLKRDGFLPCIWLSVMVCIGCCVSSVVNNAPFVLWIKGLATPYSAFALLICLHRALRSNLSGIKWFLIGAFLSSIICIFVFQPETYITAGGEKLSGEEGAEMMINHPLFWTGKISAITTLPIMTSYLSMPIAYSTLIPLINAILKVVFSMTSGRASAMVSMMSAVFIIIGRKKRISMLGFAKNIPIYLLICIAILLVFKGVYSYAARNGLLGDDAYRKYVRQTANGTSALNIVMAGRKEFFVGIRAAIDKPIVGHGPKAEDVKGYYESFLRDYGSQDDYDDYMKYQMATMNRGYMYKVIPTHSHIACAWVEDGVFGLIFWLYILWEIYKCLHFYIAAIPQWFGYFCCIIPNMVWNIFFSAYGSRVDMAMSIVCILLAKAVYERRISLPIKMELEVREHD